MQSPTESYTPGHSDNAVDFMRRRRGATHAAFVLPLLRRGTTVLDCGCGPGSITLDLARAVAPGQVLGIDAAGGQFAESEEIARREGLDVRFATGSAYNLPFPDASFDAVFSHALFEHLADPLAAARELARILTAGGLIALRSPDWGGFLLHPCPAEIENAVALYCRVQTANGGDVRAGRKLPSVLRAVGFTRVRGSASYEVYDDPHRIAEYLAQRLEPAEGDDAAANHGREAAAALRRWSRDPDALFAQAWVEAVGWKE